MEIYEKDYTCLVDIAKMNLSKKLEITIQEYEKKSTSELKKEILKIIQDRNQIFLFNISIIEKYL